MLEIDEFDPEKAYCLHQLGFIYEKIKDYANAEQCYLRSNRIKETVVLGSGTLAATYNNLNLYYNMGNYYQKSLNLKKAINDPTLGTTRINLEKLNNK